MAEMNGVLLDTNVIIEIFKENNDTLDVIAATSLSNEIPLFTYKKKDFKFIKNLKLYLLQ